MKHNIIKDEYSNEFSFKIQSEEKPVNKKISGNENKNNTTDRKNNVIKRKILKLAIIIGIIITICIIICLIILFISSKSKKDENFHEIENTSTSINNDEDTNLNEKETTNIIIDEGKNVKDKDIIINDKNDYSFTATYKTKNGESLKIFNPSRLGLKEGDYFIYESSEDSNLRRIEELEIDDGILNSTKNGITTIKVNFTSQLSNLDFMFEGCENLINVNLSNLNSSIDSMIYTFTNCKNLEQVDFTSIDTSNVTGMDFLFAGCDNLVELTGFESLNTSSVTKTAGMFSECSSLISVNLSGFDLDNIEEPSGMFINNTALQIVDLGNCNDANSIFSTQTDFNITIITRENISVINESNFNGNFKNIQIEYFDSKLYRASISCRIGEGELCKECNDENSGISKMFCKSCNEGYYLPNEATRKCIKCEDGCNDCYVIKELNSINCTSCSEGYKYFNGKCIKNCEIGENEKCLECKIDIGKNNECLICNEGYYYDNNYDKTKCKKIEIDNCIHAEFESNNIKCINCSKGYILYNNQCIEACNIGEGEKCASCNPIYEQKEYCDSCNNGYYINYEIDPKICHSCEINNCKECENNLGILNCTLCNEGYTLINNTCFESCEQNCKICYFDGINKGKCIQCKETFYLKDNYILINGQMYQNDKSCSKCPEGCAQCYDYYIMNNKISLNCSQCVPGYILKNSVCEKQCDVGEKNLCLTCNDNIKNACASCNNGYYLNETNGTCDFCNIENCIECNQNGTCLKCIEQYKQLKGKCFKTCEIGENEKCFECNNTLSEITQNCLNCNKGYYLPNDSTDKTKCIPCDIGCEECYGRVNNSICIKCGNNYQLYNNECKSECIIGLEELCNSCDEGENKLNCGSCNKGYYLPNNITEKKRCKKCNSGMISCHQDENNDDIIPDECAYPLIPSGKYCLKYCEIGYNTKCLSCREIQGEINKCGKCYTGYYLPIDSNQTKCLYCGNNCKYCNGTLTNKTCTECYSNYQLYEGRCIYNCYINNYNYYCASCSTEPGKNDRCGTCNDGYYLPVNSTNIYGNRYCSPCPKYCKKCSGDNNNPICSECLSNQYHLKNGRCFKNCLYYSTYTQCNFSHCFESVEYITYANCTKCNEGYYLPKIRRINDEYYNVCFKCSMPGCIRCEGDNNETNICLECERNANPLIVNGSIISCYQSCEIGEGGKCKSCKDGTNICGECNNEYTLYNNSCVLEYHIYAKYKTTKKNEMVKLMNYNEILKLKINNTIILNPTNKFIFQNPGEHDVYIKLREIDVFSHLFTDITHLIYIEFSDNFDSTKISLMNDCFSGCINLISIDMSKLDLKNNRCFMNFFKNNKNLIDVKFPSKEFKNIRWFYSMFEGCKKLESIDMSNVYNDNAEYYYNMFKGCTSLKELSLENFHMPYYGSQKYDLLYNVPKNATIVVHKAFYNSVKGQFNGFTNIILD